MQSHFSMEKPLRILHLEDDADFATLVGAILEQEGLCGEPVLARNLAEFAAALEGGPFDVILADYLPPTCTGLQALELARQKCPETPFLLVSGTVGEAAAIEGLQSGATDYVPKQLLERLVPAVRRAARQSEERTQRKQLEAQLRQAQKMELIGQLASGLAHDFNNILAPILVAAGALRETSTAPEDQQLLTVIEASTKRGADLVRQLLWLGRGTGSKCVLVDLKCVIAHVTRFVRETFDRAIHIEAGTAPDLWPALGDPAHLYQLLLNLCVNARDAMPAGGKLSIAGHNVNAGIAEAASRLDAKAGPHIVLTVSDTGAGIAPQIRDRIFEPFVTTKPKGLGTGLGLSTVLSIVKACGGFIQVQSEPGRGASFRVHLTAQPGLCANPPQGEALPNRPQGRGETVLVVDDEPAVRQIVQTTLEKLGYHVLTAGDGKEAFAMSVANQTVIAVTLVDLMMPVMNGTATIRALRHINPSVKVVVGTGLGNHPDVYCLRDLNIRHVLEKPYAKETLLQMLQQLIAEDPKRHSERDRSRIPLSSADHSHPAGNSHTQ